MIKEIYSLVEVRRDGQPEATGTSHEGDPEVGDPISISRIRAPSARGHTIQPQPLHHPRNGPVVQHTVEPYRAKPREPQTTASESAGTASESAGESSGGDPSTQERSNRERFNQCEISLEFSSAFTCSLVELARMKIHDLIGDRQSRAATSLFTDPETGAAIQEETLASTFISLIRLSLLRHHGKKLTLAEVRRLWSLHSLRITGLNLLEKAGCPPWLLRVTGRWLLDCHYQYTGQDHNLLATNSTSRISNQTATPAARVPVTPFPGEAHSDSLPPHPDTREMTEPGQTQVDTTLAAEATTSSWLLPGALNTDASELTDVPNTMVGRRVKKFFPG